MRTRTRLIVATAVLGLAAGGTWLQRAQLRAARTRAELAAREAGRRERAARELDIALYARRAAEDPQSAADRAQLAGLYLQRARDTGDWENYHLAERSARAALALRTERNGKAFLTLASSLLARHEFAAARAVAEEAVRSFPWEPAYRAVLAELQVEMGDYDAARASFDTLRADLRHPAVAPRYARWLELTGNVELAERVLRRLQRDVAARSDIPLEQRAWSALRLADFSLRHGQVADGEAVARAALRLAPDDGRLRLVLARGAALRGAWGETVREVERAGDAADIASLALAGDAAAALGDSASARTWWARAERAGIGKPEPFARQWTLFRLEHGVQLTATRALLEREIGQRRDVYGWDQLAMARAATGDFRGAEAAVSQALRLGTTDAVLWWHAAQVAAGAGDRAAAARRAGEALRLNPRFHHRDVVLARQMAGWATDQRASGRGGAPAADVASAGGDT